AVTVAAVVGAAGVGLVAASHAFDGGAQVARRGDEAVVHVALGGEKLVEALLGVGDDRRRPQLGLLLGPLDLVASALLGLLRELRGTLLGLGDEGGGAGLGFGDRGGGAL